MRSAKIIATKSFTSNINFPTCIARTKHTDGSESEKYHMFGILKDRVLNKVGDKTADLGRQNGFQLFGLEEKYKIDKLKLQREMRKLQKITHPDKFARGRTIDERIASDLSALVNHFYHVLGNPYERGKYLLSLMAGKSLDQIEKELEAVALDEQFLNRMMELRELIESTHYGGGRELMRIRDELERELTKLADEVGDDFETKDFESIREKLGRLKFLCNCHQACVDRTAQYDSF